MQEPTIRLANRKDSSFVAEVFMLAFPDSVDHFVKDESLYPLIKEFLSDLFALYYKSEKEAFFVCEIEGKIVGYALMPSGLNSLISKALFSSLVVKWFGILWRRRKIILHINIRDLFRDKLTFWRSTLSSRHTRSKARVLSIAMHPDYQGYGIGSLLLDHGLKYLRTKSQRVQLEVRPENTPAIRLYEKFGFKVKGTMKDSRGDWLVLEKIL